MTTDDLSPSNDFYQYVNDAWLRHPANAIPEEYSNWGGFTKLRDESLKNQIKLLKELAGKADRNGDEDKILAIWEASCARFEQWEKGEATIEPIIQEFKQLDEAFGSDAINDDATYIRKLSDYLYYTQVQGIQNCIDFDKGTDLTNSNNVVLDFSTGGLSLPSREYYTDDNFLEQREMFQTHIDNVVKLLIKKDETLKETLGDNFVSNVMDFEHELARFSMKRAHRREYDIYYTNTTLKDLHEKMDELKFVEEKLDYYGENERIFKICKNTQKNVSLLLENMYELFDFRKILASNLEKNFTFPKVDNAPVVEHITAFDGDGIKRVLAFITNKENFVKYRAYMQYKVIKTYYKFCTKDMDEEFFDFYLRKLSGQQKPKENDKRSVMTVNGFADELLGKIYVAKHFSSECKENVKRMIDDVLVIMKESIDANNWLMKDTKQYAQKKLQKFGVKIGYPDVWKDYSDFTPVRGDSLYEISKKQRVWALKTRFYEKLNSVVDRTEWAMSPQTVNAYFSPSKNEIVFPAAILQPPFFHAMPETIDFDWSEEAQVLQANDLAHISTIATNLGGIGAVIAHEITHGYDDKGRKFDADGNLNDWWTETDAELFKGKTEIMAKSANLYKYIDTEDENKEYKMDPQLTMGENLADLGGLSLSLKSLMKITASINEDCKKAATRILLKSWANVWKCNTKKQDCIRLLTIDPHAPKEFRGNLVGHMDEFYECFDVKEGCTMYVNPADRVRMW